MPWQLLIFIYVILFSISVLLRRVLLFNDKSDPIAFAIVFQGLIGAIIGIYALVHGFEAPDFRKYWIPIVATTLFYTVGNIVSAKAFQLVEASVMSVLLTTSAIWTILMGIFLFDEKLVFTDFMGIALIFLSLILLLEKKKSLKLDKGIGLGLLSAICFGLAIAEGAYVGRRADIPTWAALTFLLPAAVTLLMKPMAIAKMKPFLNRQVLIRMLSLAFIGGVASVASLFAYRDGNVNLIAILQQTAVIVSTILGIIFLHERQRLWQKIAAAAICFLGVLLLI